MLTSRSTEITGSWCPPSAPTGGLGSGDPHLSEKTFAELARLVEARCGIHLPPAKRVMAESRVRKRLRALGVDSFSAYMKLVGTRGREDEIIHLIDAVTVNKTDFFREPAHFGYLTGYALPQLAAERAAGTRSTLRLWSAGCSSGEEPYTLAMVLSEYAEKQPAGWQFSILATDICTRVLEAARTAVYPLETFNPIALNLRRKYLLRSKDPAKPTGRIEPGLRARVEFRRLNLMDDNFAVGSPMDVIFCRNVVIYFTRETQERLITRLLGQLRVGGYLFMGHSETLNTLHLPVEPVMPTVYRRTG